LVYGDLMLDEYLFGEVNRISPEAPVPIVRVTAEKWVLGGAANVASNLKALCAEPLLIGAIGKDAAGGRVRGLISDLGISGGGLVEDASKPTIIKTRVIGHSQQMLRIDREEIGPPSGGATKALMAKIREMAKGASAIIVSDYAKGAASQEIIDAIRGCANKKGIPWIVDPKPAHKRLYKGATALTPNSKELNELSQRPAKTDDELAKAASELALELGLEGLLVTRSEKGVALVKPGGGRRAIWAIPTEAREVYDVSGAGDTVIAAFAAALAAGVDWLGAAMLANAAAGVVVGKVGTATTTPQEILERL
jgi:D-beta-D-heptose 7-phosphate kinase/D-beta-D-heptose 1-phosphate adenosyltransferase